MTPSSAYSIQDRLTTATKSAGNALIIPPQDFVGRWLERTFILGLFLLGLFLWGDALEWGVIPWDQADWFDITGPRLYLLQEAMQAGQIPLHIDDPIGMKNTTDRFLSIPDVIVSPQIILLRWLSPTIFILLQTFAMYALGFWGLLRLKAYWQISLATFTPLFLIFNFNGHLVAHFSVGHATWWSVFLLSWFVLWIVQLLEHGGGWRWAARVSLLLALIFLQGGFHPFLWCWLFLAVLLLFRWQLRKPLSLALIFSLLLSLGRILPAAIINLNQRIGFLSGFTSTADLVAGLLTLRGPALALETVTPLNLLVAWWEYDFYIGWAGLIFLALGCGIWFHKREVWGKSLIPLWGTCAALTVLSIGRLYRIVFSLGIPFLNGERVSSRFFLLPLFFTASLAALAIQRILDEKKPPHSLILAGLGGLVLLFNDLLQHRELWKLDQLDKLFPRQILTPLHLANHPDPLYTAALLGGTLIAVTAMAKLLIAAHRSPD